MHTIDAIFLFCTVLGARCYPLDEVYRDVFADYQPAIKPFCHTNDVTDVYIDFALRQIVDLDEPRQFLNSIIWIRMKWEDCRLRWNSSEYENITELIIPKKKIWVPDLTLYENAADKLAGIDDYQVAIHHTGAVYHNFPSLIRSICAIDVTHFPFDYQTCNLTFGSWAYNGRQVDIFNQSSHADMTTYNFNSEWILHEVPILREVTFYGSNPFPTLVIHLRLQRRPLFYALNLLFPCFLISSVAVLGFLLPPASGEKVNLEITVLLSLAVFQLIVLELMPPSGKVSFMGLYFMVSLILVGFSCFTTVVVLNIHFKGYQSRPGVPRWMMKIFVKPLAKLLCVDVENSQVDQYTISFGRKNSKSFETPNISSGEFRYKSRGENNDIFTTMTEPSSPITDTGRGVPENELPAQTYSHAVIQMPKQAVGFARAIHEHLETINTINQDEQCQNNKGSEWMTFALILDRLFLVLYLLFLLLCCLSLSIKFIVVSAAPDNF